MPRQSRTAKNQPEAPNITWHGYHTLEERETRVREAAYYRYLEHGCCDGHDVEDWLQAEAEVDHGKAESMQAQPAHEVQQSSRRGPVSDDKLKRAIKRHPRKAASGVDGPDAAESPDRP